MNDEWTLFVADAYGVRLCQVDVYHSCTLIIRHNAVSTWELQLPTDTTAGATILDLIDRLSLAPGARLIFRLADRVVRSGPVIRVARRVDVTGDDLTLNGVDDFMWLTRRVAHPMPASLVGGPYSQAYDVRTGDVAQILAQYVDVNAGPSAIGSRRVAGLTCPIPAPAGVTITMSARWQNLAEFLVATAEANDLGIDIVDNVLHVTKPVDTGAVFSLELGTMAELDAVEDAPTANHVYVAGQGEGAARIVRSAADSLSRYRWGHMETFVDRRDTADNAMLDQAGAETLAQSVIAPTTTFVPLDTPAQIFGTHWHVGDLATVRVGDETRVDVVREATVRLEGGKPIETVVRIGSSGDLALVRATINQSRRIRQLERA